MVVDEKLSPVAERDGVGRQTTFAKGFPSRRDCDISLGAFRQNEKERSAESRRPLPSY